MAADPTARDADGWTTLHRGASRGNGPLVDRLCAAGGRSAKLDDGQPPADIARARGLPALAARLGGA